MAVTVGFVPCVETPLDAMRLAAPLWAHPRECVKKPAVIRKNMSPCDCRGSYFGGDGGI